MFGRTVPGYCLLMQMDVALYLVAGCLSAVSDGRRLSPRVSCMDAVWRHCMWVAAMGVLSR